MKTNIFLLFSLSLSLIAFLNERASSINLLINFSTNGYKCYDDNELTFVVNVRCQWSSNCLEVKSLFTKLTKKVSKHFVSKYLLQRCLF